MKENELDMILLLNGPIPTPKAKVDTKNHLNIFCNILFIVSLLTWVYLGSFCSVILSGARPPWKATSCCHHTLHESSYLEVFCHMDQGV